MISRLNNFILADTGFHTAEAKGVQWINLNCEGSVIKSLQLHRENFDVLGRRGVRFPKYILLTSSNDRKFFEQICHPFDLAISQFLAWNNSINFWDLSS